MEGKLTEEDKQFKKVDERLDNVFKNDAEQARKRSKVELRPKTYMNISDVDVEDARWFKGFCDKYFVGKQFTAIKFIRQVMERFDPLVTNVLDQINQLNKRMDGYEVILEQVMKQEEEPPQVQIPRTQSGSARRAEKEKMMTKKEEAEK